MDSFHCANKLIESVLQPCNVHVGIRRRSGGRSASDCALNDMVSESCKTFQRHIMGRSEDHVSSVRKSLLYYMKQL